MSLVLITGGARSGKSGAATRLALQRSLDGADVVVAVFGAEDESEMTDRIARHRLDRPEGFGVIEAIDASTWRAEVPDGAVLLLDCLGTLLGRVMAESWPAGDFDDAPADALPPGYAQSVERDFTALVAWIGSRRADTIVVTNEVGDGVVPAYATGRLFRDLLGQANRALLGDASAAYLAVAGRLLDLHALPTDATWPED